MADRLASSGHIILRCPIIAYNTQVSKGRIFEVTIRHSESGRGTVKSTPLPPAAQCLQIFLSLVIVDTSSM